MQGDARRVGVFACIRTIRLSVKSMGASSTDTWNLMKATWKGVTNAVKQRAQIITTSQKRTKRERGSMVRIEMERSRFLVAITCRGEGRG